MLKVNHINGLHKSSSTILCLTFKAKSAYAVCEDGFCCKEI